MRSGLVAALAALLVAALAPAAGATLVYQKGFERSNVYAANDNGSGAVRIAAGRSPHVAPNGQLVAFANRFDAKGRTDLLLAPTAGGAAKTILTDYREFPFAWSSDSRYIATTTGPEVGPWKLVLIDLVGGTTRTIATAPKEAAQAFSGVSFSPDSSTLVYSVPVGRGLWSRTDLWTAPTAGGAPTRLTTDGHSLAPLWGPNQIAFVRWARPTGKERKIDGPKYQLWLMNPDGGGVRQLTHGRVPFLLTGLTPTAWSADGTRLLAQFGGQDTSYPVTVDPATGAQHRIGPPKLEQSIAATALSRDGSTVLGFDNPFEATSTANVVTLPYAGGKASVLVRHAVSPDWSR
jgi:Tol biopolymer transport system component